MSRRVVIGKRSNGDTGLFVGPPGVDAFTAADSSLVMNISSKISQLILLGHISGSASTITLGLSLQPYVFLTGTYDLTSSGATGLVGPMRPSPFINPSANSNVVINSGGASMTITPASVPVNYAVYSKAF